MEYKVRRFIDTDTEKVCNLIAKDLREENIKDYTREAIEKIIESQNKDIILKRSRFFHAYVFIEGNKIIGIGMIGPYWDSLTESSLFTIFIDPLYKGKGLGRKIIETLEKDEYFLRAERVEIPASITAVEFYKHMGYGFKKFGNIVDEEGHYKMEKYPKISTNNSSKTQYNMRPFLDNEYHSDKKFIYKYLYKKINLEDIYPKKEFNDFINNIKDSLWMIQLNGINIGYYIKDESLKNIFVLPEYQYLKIEQQVLNDVEELLNIKKGI